MSVSITQIEKIAALARIALSEEEKRQFARELSAVIEYFRKLQAVDTPQPSLELSETDTGSTAREDKAADDRRQEQILSQAPLREENFFKVKSVL